MHLYLSPHEDDVALSCGGHIAQLTQRGEHVVIFRDVVERHGVDNLPALRYLERKLLASPAGNDDPVVLAPCDDTPAQYWVVDGDGLVWNGLPPQPIADMAQNHVRCLGTAGGADAAASAAI